MSSEKAETTVIFLSQTKDKKSDDMTPSLPFRLSVFFSFFLKKNNDRSQLIELWIAITAQDTFDLHLPVLNIGKDRPDLEYETPIYFFELILKVYLI